jgi:anti-sigma factor RsiW
MSCRRNDIKSLLPAYLTDQLDQSERKTVDAHCAACDDCAGELHLIRILAAEPVPDPGEAFWEALPNRVYRDVQRREADRPTRSSTFFASLFLHRRAAAAAVAVMVITGSLFLLPLARKGPPADRGGDTLLSEGPAADADVLSGLGQEDIAKLESWASEELVALQASAMDSTSPSPYREQNLEEVLDPLDQREAEQLLIRLQERSGGAS